jgi:ELWxxDGT repeat protein
MFKKISIFLAFTLIVSSFSLLTFIEPVKAAAPTVSLLSPANGWTLTASTTDLSIVFSEAVNIGSGNITIKEYEGDAVFEVIDVSSAQVTGAGDDMITINPSSNLESATWYYVEVDAGAFESVSTSDDFAGISGSATWLFRAEDRSIIVRMVADINPSGNAFPGMFEDYNAVIGDEIVFYATDGVNGYELWKTDGTDSGTVMVKDINTTPGAGSSPTAFQEVNGLATFRATDGTGFHLWVTDGTEAGTVKLYAADPGGDYGLYNDELYFRMNAGGFGSELWKTDGTASGTVMVADINPAGNSSPDNYGVAGGYLYFQATNGSDGYELWRTDGTASGTVMVADINPAGDGSPVEMTELGSKVIFQGYDDTYEEEPWVSDGTGPGTFMLKDIWDGSGSWPYDFEFYDGEIYFAAYDEINETELWKTDGTSLGTVLVQDIYPGGDGYPEELYSFNGLLFMRADSGDGYELHVYDGSTVTQIKEFDPTGNGSPRYFYGFDGDLYMDAISYDVYGSEPWKSNGTATGTVMLKDINPNSGNSLPRGFIDAGGKLFFGANDGVNGYEVWVVEKAAAPVMDASVVSSISAVSASVSSGISSVAIRAAEERGFVWDTSSGPTVDNNLGMDSSLGLFEAGAFSGSVTGLSCGNTYYIRSFATSPAGTSYGAENSFNTTACSCPTVDNAATYNAYPACGAATCVSGYYLSGGACLLSGGSSSTPPPAVLLLIPGSGSPTPTVGAEPKSSSPQSSSGGEAGTIASQSQRVELSSAAKTAYEKVAAKKQFSVGVNYQVAKFIGDGTPSTGSLGAGERAGIIDSFIYAFNKEPNGESDWNDILKIANGQTPSVKNEDAEKRAKEVLEKIIPGSSGSGFLVNMVAYGLRPAVRSLAEESISLKVFGKIFKRLPNDAFDWNVLRAMSYGSLFDK